MLALFHLVVMMGFFNWKIPDGRFHLLLFDKGLRIIRPKKSNQDSQYQRNQLH
jgi:hypothetical protein